MWSTVNGPRHEKTCFLNMLNQRRRSATRSPRSLSAPLFAKVQSMYFVYRTLQASGHILLLFSRFCVGLGRNPRRHVLSWRGSKSFTRPMTSAYEPRSEKKKRSSGFPTRSDTTRAVQQQKMARDLKFRI